MLSQRHAGTNLQGLEFPVDSLWKAFLGATQRIQRFQTCSKPGRVRATSGRGCIRAGSRWDNIPERLK